MNDEANFSLNGTVNREHFHFCATENAQIIDLITDLASIIRRKRMGVFYFQRHGALPHTA